MKMTTRGLYALEAILTLAEVSEHQKPVSLQKIAEIEGLSQEFLQQIFYRLRKAGIINAARGPGGGFSLNRTPDDISAYEVLSAVGETLEIVPCVCQKSSKRPCKKFASCDAGSFWVGMQERIIDYAKSKRLSEMRREDGQPLLSIVTSSR